MKTTTLALTVFLTVVCVDIASAGQGVATSQSFVESSRRQDFTGQGTYHRQGLLREQRNATKLAEVNSTAPASTVPRRNLWQSFTRLFERK